MSRPAFGILLHGSWDPDRVDAAGVRAALDRMVLGSVAELSAAGVVITTSQFREVPSKAQEGNDVSVQDS